MICILAFPGVPLSRSLGFRSDRFRVLYKLTRLGRERGALVDFKKRDLCQLPVSAGDPAEKCDARVHLGGGTPRLGSLRTPVRLCWASRVPDLLRSSLRRPAGAAGMEELAFPGGRNLVSALLASSDGADWSASAQARPTSRGAGLT